MRLSRQAIAAAAFLVAVAAFLPTIFHGFVGDDVGNYLKNPAFGPLRWEGVRWAFTATTLGVYQPLAWLFAEAQCTFFGLEPRGYHVVSVLLHAVNVLSFHSLLVALGIAATPLSAGIAVALFAAHPLNTETVAWISCQPYLLCAFFLLQATRFHVRQRPWLTLVFFVLALLSKAPAVMFPFVLLLLDRGKDLPRKLPLFVLSGVFVAVAIWARTGYSGAPPYELPARLVQLGYGLFYLASRAVAPVGLAGFFSMPPESELLTWGYVVPAALTVLAFSVALALANKRAALLLIPFVVLLPNLGMKSFSQALIADRYFYLASLAAFAAISLLRRPWAALALLVLLPLSWRESGIWKNNETFWAAAIARGHGTPMAHYHYGYALAQGDRPNDAVPHLRQAITESRDVVEQVRWLNDLGVLLRERSNPAPAVPWLNLAVAIDPTSAVALNNLGAALFDLRFLPEAEARFREALSLDPGYQDALENLAKLEEVKDEIEREIVSLIGKVKTRQRDTHLLNQLAVLLSLRGLHDEALVELGRAMRIDRESEETLENFDSIRRLKHGPPRGFPPGMEPRGYASER